MPRSKTNKTKAKKNIVEPVPPVQKYELHFVKEALTEWKALDGSVKEPLRKALEKRLNAPHVPGSALVKQGYRLVYCVEDNMLVVMVMSVAKREDSEAYVLAKKRYDAHKLKRKETEQDKT